MKRFATLFAALDATTRTSEKTDALLRYFQDAPDSDKVWTVAVLSGRRPRRAVSTTDLRRWAAARAGVPDWLFEESYAVVGDLAETIAHLLPAPAVQADISLSAMMAALEALHTAPPEDREARVLALWDSLAPTERFVFNKLITGGFRMGVSQGLMTRALAQATGVDEASLAHRLMGNWQPRATSFASLVSASAAGRGAAPFPFALAHPLEEDPASLGARADWVAEWKWDGIRGQIVCRPDAFAIWSRGEDLVTDRFPELAALGAFLPPGTVLDGEILCWQGEAPLPFARLQTRLGRKTLPKRLLAEAPVQFLAYDLLEDRGEDIRDLPLAARKARLEMVLASLPAGLPLRPSQPLAAPDWGGLKAARHEARAMKAEGLMLKSATGPYLGGRKRGAWWKWKLDPFSVDAVMIYAQAGHGRRAGLYSDYTFALREGAALVPFAKAYSGLSDAEMAQITRWVTRNTLERFGPVRRVVPELVFEIAFEGIQSSPRHKAGVALRFPRIARWRQDKTPDQIDSLDHLRALAAQGG